MAELVEGQAAGSMVPATAAADVPPAATGWVASTFDALNFPVYRVLWLGSVLAFLAFNMAATAQSVVAFDLTGNNRAVGFVMFGQGLAMCLLNPFGGAVADRFSKRFLILFSQVVIGGVLLATAILIAVDAISILILASFSFSFGMMFSFLGPTRTALLGEVVPESRIGNAMALLQVGNNFSRISGPFLAGTLLAWPFIGSTGTYFIVAAIFVFVLLTLSRIPETPRPTPREKTSVFADVGSGIRYVRSRPQLLQTVVSFNIVMILAMGNFVLLPGFVKEVLDSGTQGLGVMLGAAAAAGFVVSLLVASLADSRKAPFLLSLSAIGAGLGLVLTGFAPTFPIAVATFALATAGISAFQTLNNSVALRQTEQEYHGRVMGLAFAAWGLINLSSLPIGYLADIFGEREVLVACGVLLSIATLLIALWRSRLGDETRADGLAPADEAAG